jgi:hypothetical protein
MFKVQKNSSWRLLSSEWQTEELAKSFLEGVRGAIPGAELQFDVIARIVQLWFPTQDSSSIWAVVMVCSRDFLQATGSSLIFLSQCSRLRGTTSVCYRGRESSKPIFQPQNGSIACQSPTPWTF